MRIVIIAVFLITVVLGSIWLLSPRTDQRFVGSWSYMTTLREGVDGPTRHVEQPGIYRLESSGLGKILYDQEGDDFTSIRWCFLDDQLVIDYQPRGAELVSDLLTRAQYAFAGIPVESWIDRLSVVEYHPDRITLRDTKWSPPDEKIVTLTRRPENDALDTRRADLDRPPR